MLNKLSCQKKARYNTDIFFFHSAQLKYSYLWRKRTGELQDEGRVDGMEEMKKRDSDCGKGN